MSTIHLSPPDIGQLEETYVLDALRSGCRPQIGSQVHAFEREVAERAGVAHAVAVSSGTAALHLVLVAWGVGRSDTVVTSTMTPVGTANAIAYTGARPFFVDCDPESGNLDPALLERTLSGLRDRGRSAPVVIPVDLFGKCADYPAIDEIALRHDALVLADATSSLGAERGHQAAGSFGDAAVVSFNGSIVAAGGGMVLTEDAKLAKRARYLAAGATTPASPDNHTEIGFDYRLPDILAAVGRAQLARLEPMLQRRRVLRDRYAKTFASWSGVRILGSDDAQDNCWLTALIVDPDVAGWAAEDLADALAEAGIDTRPLWKPMHLQPVFANCPRLVNGHAAALFNRGLLLPSGSAMNDEQVERVFYTLGEWLES